MDCCSKLQKPLPGRRAPTTRRSGCRSCGNERGGYQILSNAAFQNYNNSLSSFLPSASSHMKIQWLHMEKAVRCFKVSRLLCSTGSAQSWTCSKVSDVKVPFREHPVEASDQEVAKET